MRATMFGRALVGGVCAVLVLGGAAGLAGPASAAVTCDPDGIGSRGDIDGDSSADAVVGMPYYGDGSGAVDVRLTGSPTVFLRSGLIGAGTGEGDGFGAEVAVGDLDQDGCADLVVAAPNEAQSDASDGAGGNEGQVHIVFGSPTGLDLTGAITLPHDSEGFDGFGTSLALVARTVAGATVHDLYVGAPGATVGGHPNAGEVFRFTVTPAQGTRVVAPLREVRSQDSAGVPGGAETGDGFGSVLAGSDGGGGVLVGAPLEDIGTARNAGAVWFLRLGPAGTPIASQSWSQDSPAVPGRPETGDHFGAALSSRGSTTIVGVPDENAGSKVDTGMVQLLERNVATAAYAPAGALTQDSPGIPGAAEAGDRFGAAVAAGVGFICQESIDLAIGAPGEDLGGRSNTGALTVTPLTDQPGCAPRTLRQGAGLGGAAETGDAVGAILGVTRGRTDLDEDYADRLLIGVPLEDIGANRDAGMVQPSRGGITVDGALSAALTYSQGYLTTNDYGMVLSSASD